MAWILFDVVQDDMLVCAEDCSCQAVLDRNRDFRQLGRVRACRGGKVQAWIFLIVQQNGGAFTFQQLGRCEVMSWSRASRSSVELRVTLNSTRRWSC